MAKGDIVLRIEGKATGPIAGESANDAAPGAIDVHEWSWGMSGPSAMGGGGAASKVALSEIRITKGVDRASTALMSVMRNNEQIKKAVLTMRKSSGGKAIDYLIVTLERGRISAYDIGTVAPDEPLMVERLSIAFEKIEIAYAAQDAKGGKTASSTFTASTT
jgi:type VI secretion system secreted protein Hcp